MVESRNLRYRDARQDSCWVCGRKGRYCLRLIKGNDFEHRPACGYHRWTEVSAILYTLMGRPEITKCLEHPSEEMCPTPRSATSAARSKKSPRTPIARKGGPTSRSASTTPSGGRLSGRRTSAATAPSRSISTSGTHSTQGSRKPPRPLLLDLFCGPGGAGVGYNRAGFDVVGVDRDPQPSYPYHFVQADVLDLPIEYLASFDAIHASPPCQAHSRATSGHKHHHIDMIPVVRRMLMQAGVPSVIENVPDARHHLRRPVMLCGTMFGLPLQRHRFFETTLQLTKVPSCMHAPGVDLCFDMAGGRAEGVYRDAMGCGWMRCKESRQAIPPAFTRWIGRYLRKSVERRRCSYSVL